MKPIPLLDLRQVCVLACCLWLAPGTTSFAQSSGSSGDVGEQGFSLETCLKKGLQRYQVNDYATAILYFDQAKMLAPNRADISYYLGSCHDNQGDKRNAQRFYEKSMQLDPDGTFGKAASSALKKMMVRRTAAPDSAQKLEQDRLKYLELKRHFEAIEAAQRESRAAEARRAAEDRRAEEEQRQTPVPKPLSVKDKLNSVVSDKHKNDKHFSSTVDIIHRHAQIESDNAGQTGDAGATGVRRTAANERERIKQQLADELRFLENKKQEHLRAGNAAEASDTEHMQEWLKRKAEKDMTNASQVGDFKFNAYAKWKSARQQAISDSACNLLTQIQSQKQRGGFGLQSVGTNLYTRQYGLPGALLPPVHPSVARVFPAGSSYNNDSPPNYLIPDDPRFPATQDFGSDGNSPTTPIEGPRREVRGAILKDGPNKQRLP